jgi:hypothetical protein
VRDRSTDALCPAAGVDGRRASRPVPYVPPAPLRRAEGGGIGPVVGNVEREVGHGKEAT